MAFTVYFIRSVLFTRKWVTFKQSQESTIFVMRCAFWYHSCIIKNVKNIYGGVLLLIKLQATLLKVTFLSECFSRFFKSNKWYHMVQSISFDHWQKSLLSNCFLYFNVCFTENLTRCIVCIERSFTKSRASLRMSTDSWLTQRFTREAPFTLWNRGSISTTYK